MEYVTPPRAASILLNLFASEADFAIVLGDLSEEFQKRVSAQGHASARCWYWRESFRNVFAWIAREFLRTPVQVLTITLLADVSAFALVGLLMGPLRLDVRWAWVSPTGQVMLRMPLHYWPWIPFFWSILVPALLYAGTGAIASSFMRGRELAVAVCFAIWPTVYGIWVLYILTTYSSPRGRLPRTFNLLRDAAAAADTTQLNEHVVIQWIGTIVLFCIGCFWIRWHRISRLSSR